MAPASRKRFTTTASWLGNVVRAALGSAGADHSLRLDGVFQRERHAVQGADRISPRQRLVGAARFLESFARHTPARRRSGGDSLLRFVRRQARTSSCAEISFFRIAAAMAVAD